MRRPCATLRARSENWSSVLNALDVIHPVGCLNIRATANNRPRLAPRAVAALGGNIHQLIRIKGEKDLIPLQPVDSG